MAKAKSLSRVDYPDPGTGSPDGNGHELDPLIDALLEHLPAPGDPFPPELRQLWMQILELSLKLIYDEAHPEQPDAEPA